MLFRSLSDIHTAPKTPTLVERIRERGCKLAGNRFADIFMSRPKRLVIPEVDELVTTFETILEIDPRLLSAHELLKLCNLMRFPMSQIQMFARHFAAEDWRAALQLYQLIPANSSDENTVIGRASAAEIVIVHAGKVVMDKRVGVDALHGAGGGEGEGFRSSGSPGRGQAEDGAESFSAGQQAVAHGFVDEGGMGLGGDEAIERLFHQRKTGFPIGLRIHRDDMTNFVGEWQAGRVRPKGDGFGLESAGLLITGLEWGSGVA